MDFSHHRAKFPRDISEYFFSSWEKRKIWSIKGPRRTLSIGDLEWHLDCPFWSSKPPAALFDLRPRAVLHTPREFPEHWNRVLASDLTFPIDVAFFGGRLVILDGFHRLLKSIHAGASVMECKVVARAHIRTAGRYDREPSVEPA